MNLTTGNYNTALGQYAGYDTSTGGYNLYLGNEAGKSNTSGSLTTSF